MLFEPFGRSVHHVTLTAVLVEIARSRVVVSTVTAGVLGAMFGGAGMKVVLRGVGKEDIAL